MKNEKEELTVRKYMNVTEAATYLCVSPQTIYDWVHRRSIPCRHHGRKLAFLSRELDAWSDAKKVNAYEKF